MKKIAPMKLNIPKETIRTLTLKESASVHGGSMCGGTKISSCVTHNQACKPPEAPDETATV